MLKREVMNSHIPLDSAQYKHILWCRTCEFDKLRFRSDQFGTITDHGGVLGAKHRLSNEAKRRDGALCMCFNVGQTQEH